MPERSGGACNRRPAYQAQVWSSRDRKTIRKTFRTLAEARGWRAKAKSALSLGTMRAPTRTTVSEAAEAWLTAAKAGVIRTRSGDPYKPSALRAYEQVLRATISTIENVATSLDGTAKPCPLDRRRGHRQTPAKFEQLPKDFVKALTAR